MVVVTSTEGRVELGDVYLMLEERQSIYFIYMLQVTDMTACLELISKLERTPISKEVLEVCHFIVSPLRNYYLFKDNQKRNQVNFEYTHTFKLHD